MNIILLVLGILPTHSRTDSQSGVLTHSRSSSKGSAEEIASQPKHKELAGNVRQKMLLDYNIYMAKCVPQEKKSPSGSPVLSADSSPTAVKKVIPPPPQKKKKIPSNIKIYFFCVCSRVD